jgi:hypothetical protein
VTNRGYPRNAALTSCKKPTIADSVNTVTTGALTPAELRQLVEEVLTGYGMTVEEFVAADIDDLPSDELRDMWLMVKGTLVAA